MQYLSDSLTGIDKEQFDTLYRVYDINDTISNDDVLLSMSIPVVVRYNYICLSGRYSFNKDFGEQESAMYFSRMKNFSRLSINAIIDTLDHDYHFSRTHLNTTVIKELKTELKTQHIPDDILLYHFALYTDKSGRASREEDIKSPRIHFILGKYGMIYILFYDPYHELC